MELCKMHCMPQKYVLLLVDPAFQTFSLFTLVGRAGCGCSGTSFMAECLRA